MTNLVDSMGSTTPLCEGLYHLKICDTMGIVSENEQNILKALFEVMNEPYDGEEIEGLIALNGSEGSDLFRSWIKKLGQDPDYIDDIEKLHDMEFIAYVYVGYDETGVENIIVPYCLSMITTIPYPRNHLNSPLLPKKVGEFG